MNTGHIVREDDGPVRYVVEVPDDGNGHVGPRGDLSAPYLLGTASVDAPVDAFPGKMAEHAVLEAAYTAFSGSEHDLDAFDPDASLRVWRVRYETGGVRFR